MTWTALWFLLAGAAAVVDWFAVWTARVRVESAAKPLVMVAAIGAAVGGIDDGPTRVLIVAGLTLGLAGDVLLLPAVDRFVAGLAAFLFGHLAYVLAFARVGAQPGWLLLGAVLAALLVTTLGRRIVGAVTGRLRLPVMAYIAVIGAMVATAVATGELLLALGGSLFAASDGLLGWDRFVDARTDRRVAVHFLYHCGQLLIVAGAVGLVTS